MLAIRAGSAAPAVEPPGAQPAATEENQLDKLRGQPMILRRGPMPGAPGGLSRRNRKPISSRGAWSGWIKCIGPLSTPCPSRT